MKKIVVFIAIFIAAISVTSAQEIKKDLFNLEDFAFEGYLTNDYHNGSFSKYSLSSIGGGIYTEYTLPFNIFTDVGVCVRIEGASQIINSDKIESM